MNTPLQELIERNTSVRGFVPNTTIGFYLPFERSQFLSDDGSPSQLDLQFQLAIKDRYDGKLNSQIPLDLARDYFELIFADNLIRPADLSVEGVNRSWNVAEAFHLWNLITAGAERAAREYHPFLG